MVEYCTCKFVIMYNNFSWKELLDAKVLRPLSHNNPQLLSSYNTFYMAFCWYCLVAPLWSVIKYIILIQAIYDTSHVFIVIHHPNCEFIFSLSSHVHLLTQTENTSQHVALNDGKNTLKCNKGETSNCEEYVVLYSQWSSIKVSQGK